MMVKAWAVKGRSCYGRDTEWKDGAGPNSQGRPIFLFAAHSRDICLKVPEIWVTKGGEERPFRLPIFPSDLFTSARERVMIKLRVKKGLCTGFAVLTQ